MKFKSVVAHFLLDPYSQPIRFGNKDYHFLNNQDFFYFMKDATISSIYYRNRRFTTTSQEIFDTTEVSVHGVYKRTQGNITSYYLCITDLRKLKLAAAQNKEYQPVEFQYIVEEGETIPVMFAGIEDDSLNKFKPQGVSTKELYSTVIIDPEGNPVVEKSAIKTLNETNINLETISVVKVLVEPKQTFYNVVGSTHDPLPSSSSWIALWQQQFGLTPTLCESKEDNNGVACKAHIDQGLVGGHVLITDTRTSIPSIANDDCYLTPICKKHNNDRKNEKPDITPMHANNHKCFLRLIGYLRQT